MPNELTDEVEEFGQKRRVTNREETIAARERQRKMQNAFKKWIFDDPERREYLVEKYNRMFNNTVVPTFDGSYLSFPGMNPEIELKPHQKDAVARMMQGKNTLLHHCVGGMGYGQKFIREETLIFFIRAKETPDTPLVTVEYSLLKKKVLQCYSERNHTPSKPILNYVNNVWLPYANRKLNRIAA